ncbi:MAG: hypothetical protein R2830_19310 [Saprospiraceae bacterium]
MNNLPTTAHLKGTRTETAHGGNAKVWLNGKQLNLQASLKYCSKSPTGFNWGYGGSGPAQLAHEICRQIYGLKIARQVFQGFKHRYLANIQDDGFDLTLDLSDFNRDYVRPFLDSEFVILEGTDNGPTGHGDECYSDADSGL